MDKFEMFVAFVLLSPLCLSAYVAVSKNLEAVAQLDRLFARAEAARSHAVMSASWFQRQVVGRLLWVFPEITARTTSIADPFHRAASRVAAGGYAALLLCAAILLAAYVALMLLLVILVIAVVVVGALAKSGNLTGRAGTAAPPALGAASSRVREKLFGGQVVEHLDANGKVVGESEKKAGFFGGQYTEHRDTTGKVVGESREREKLFGGHYTEHTDTAGRVVAESEVEQDGSGNRYERTRTVSGTVISDSRERVDAHGKTYSDHEALTR